MEESNYTTTSQRQSCTAFDQGDVGNNLDRLDELIRLNREYEIESAKYTSFSEQVEAESMHSPVSTKQAFSRFGLLLGSIPTLTLFGRIMVENDSGSELWPWMVLALIGISATATAGFLTGKALSVLVKKIEALPWPLMLLLAPAVGLLWGGISGALGGFLLLIVGAIFGAMIGSAVGTFAFPVFLVIHRFLKRGDQIESKHFYPLALGITAVISAFILS